MCAMAVAWRERFVTDQATYQCMPGHAPWPWPERPRTRAPARRSGAPSGGPPTARRRHSDTRAQVHGVNLELPARRAAAQDFDLGGGFHYSGSYPMVFQHSGARPRAERRCAEPREQRGERQPARAAGGQPTPGMVMPTGWIVVGHTPHGRRTPHAAHSPGQRGRAPPLRRVDRTG